VIRTAGLRAVFLPLLAGCTNQASAGIGHDDRPDLRPREVHVESVESVDLVTLAGGAKLRLSGVEQADHPLADGAQREARRARLAAELAGKTLWLRPDPPRPMDPAELRGELFEGADSVSERLLARGDARLDLTRGPAAGDERFIAAARAASDTARRASIPLGFQNGVVLPLYSKDKRHDYGPRLKEIHDLGAGWVSMLFVWNLDRMDGHGIAPRRDQPNWEDNRTPHDDDLVAAVRTAKSLGLRVLLLPVVLPWKPGPDDWRGNIRPANRDAFFESYARFVTRHADLAETLHVDAFSIGSELISLESKMPGDVPWWRRIAKTVRGRFSGRLTYSSNWDHYEEVGVWDELDFVGLTAYYSLTKDPQANVEQLVEAWKPVKETLRRFSDKVRRPLVFTEVGYAALRGINTDPWNYKMDEPIDLAVQVRCYEAFGRAFADADFLAGAYFFDWFDDGGPQDTGYTPRGKPAETVLRSWLASSAKRGVPPLDPARPVVPPMPGGSVGSGAR